MGMKNLLVVLSAAAIAGLCVYALFDLQNAFGVLGNSVHMNISTFVWLIAALTLASAALTLALRTALHRADRGVLARLAELEKQRAS